MARDGGRGALDTSCRAQPIRAEHDARTPGRQYARRDRHHDYALATSWSARVTVVPPARLRNPSLSGRVAGATSAKKTRRFRQKTSRCAFWGRAQIFTFLLV